MKFEHEIELANCGISRKDLPLSLKTTIQNWERKRDKTAPDDAEGQRWLKARSVAISDEIAAFAEKDLPDEESTPNQNNMPTTEEIKAAEEKAAADKAAAQAAEKEKADKEAKEKADKEAAAEAAKKKSLQDDDDDDFVPGLM